ncbi:MAG: FAD binding domain-containing protein, partial [Beijerinckiaceae bacterium]
PAADGVPPLLALDAAVELTSASGSRTIPLSEFILGNRKTALRPGELLTAVLAPFSAAGERSVFLKLGARSYLVISIASVAANISLDAEGRIAAARIAVGACSAAPVRLHALEARLAGERPGNVLITDSDLPELAPIDDVRASAAYRQASAQVLVERAIRGFAATGEGAA